MLSLVWPKRVLFINRPEALLFKRADSCVEGLMSKGVSVPCVQRWGDLVERRQVSHVHETGRISIEKEQVLVKKWSARVDTQTASRTWGSGWGLCIMLKKTHWTVANVCPQWNKVPQCLREEIISFLCFKKKFHRALFLKSNWMLPQEKCF